MPHKFHLSSVHSVSLPRTSSRSYPLACSGSQLVSESSDGNTEKPASSRLARGGIKRVGDIDKPHFLWALDAESKMETWGSSAYHAFSAPLASQDGDKLLAMTSHTGWSLREVSPTGVLSSSTITPCSPTHIFVSNVTARSLHPFHSMKTWPQDLHTALQQCKNDWQVSGTEALTQLWFPCQGCHTHNPQAYIHMPQTTSLGVYDPLLDSQGWGEGPQFLLLLLLNILTGHLRASRTKEVLSLASVCVGGLADWRVGQLKNLVMVSLPSTRHSD